MKHHEKCITGRIANDGSLLMPMTELKEFAKGWKNTRIVATFRVYNPGTSEALKGYYYNYIVPSVKAALWESGERKTDEQTERYLREISPIMYHQEADPDTGKYATELREIKDLDNSELIEHIETIKEFAAENLNIYIEDPKVI